MSRRSSLVAVIAAAAVLLGLVAASGALSAGRPPLPQGAVQIAPGHVPSTCSGQFDAYNSNYGYYWSTRGKQWVQAPRCFPRWGYLSAAGTTAVRAGQTVTVTAIPDGGSNSATYAPQTRSISWTYPGKRVRGCTTSSLSCTVIPFAKATAEWQWGEFRVSMPRTFFVDHPGSNCAGHHLCPGVTTQAWAWAGVAPKGYNELKGRVRQDCSAVTSCSSRDGIPGVEIRASGEATASAFTDANGTWKMLVPRDGTYTLKPRLARLRFGPPSRKIKVKGDKKGIDFVTCTPKGLTSTRALRAIGHIAVTDGASYQNPEGIESDVNCARQDFTVKVTGTTVTVAWEGHFTTDKEWKGGNLETLSGTSKGFTPDQDFEVKVEHSRGVQSGSGTVKLMVPSAAPDRVMLVTAYGLVRVGGDTKTAYVNTARRPEALRKPIELYPGGKPVP